MSQPYILLFMGLILIFLEFFLPGAVLGTIGAILLLWSWFSIAAVSESLLEVSLFIGGSLAALYGIVRFALWKIPRSKSSFNIYLKGDQEGYVASGFDKEAIGREGVVLTDLKPGGYILIGNEQHQALSQSGYLSKGEKVIVLSGEGESLIVKKKEKHD
jgi:membrane-bound serine protease (ClpP class)